MNRRSRATIPLNAPSAPACARQILLPVESTLVSRTPQSGDCTQVVDLIEQTYLSRKQGHHDDVQS
jgi:hypothetical protein